LVRLEKKAMALPMPVATGLTPQTAEDLVQRVIDVYRKLDKRKRLGKVIDAIGLEEFKSRIGL